MTLQGWELVQALWPELILICGASLVLLMGLAAGRSRSNFAAHCSMGVVLLALWAAWSAGELTAELTVGLLQDSLVRYARLLTLAVGLLVLLANRHVPEPTERAEFFALVLFSLAGLTLVSVANDLVLLFLALELVSVPTYILIGLSRRDMRAQEATGKYFFLGAFAAAITLYGFSFLYGAAGTTRFFSAGASEASLASVLMLPSRSADQLVILGMLLSLGGLAFKLAAVPLHFYVADVYQGAASPVAGMLGFVPKFAGFVAIIRLLSMTGWVYGEGMFWLLWALAAATMIVGNTLALMQHNVKRMLAYSSVAHSGYMLVALAAGPGLGKPLASGPMSSGLAALLFYMAVYGVMNLGAFVAFSFFRKAGEEEEDSAESLDDLAGSARRHPWACLALAICVLSLMGLPPTGGFFGKLYVLSAALFASAGTNRHGAMLALVVIAVINSAVAAAYYLRIVASCYLRGPTDEPVKLHGSRCATLKACLAVCAIVVLATFLRPGALMQQSRQAVIDVRARAVGPPGESATADSVERK